MIKKTYKLSPECQEYGGIFSWDSQIEEFIQYQKPHHACYVFDRDKIETYIQASFPGNEKVAEIQINKHRAVTLGAFKRGEQFSGVVTTGLPHLQYQSEGTRIISMASIVDAACLRLMIQRHV